MAGNNYICFYSHFPADYAPECESYVFSQWYPCKFEDPDTGTVFTSSEQYMMAKKAEVFGDAAMLASIMASDHPEAINAMGRKVSDFNAEEWKRVAYDIVLQGNRLKFSQNAALLKALLSTGNALLVEASPYDLIWGSGIIAELLTVFTVTQFPGTNLLGKALTQVREELRGEQERSMANPGALPAGKEEGEITAGNPRAAVEEPAVNKDEMPPGPPGRMRMREGCPCCCGGSEDDSHSEDDSGPED